MKVYLSCRVHRILPELLGGSSLEVLSGSLSQLLGGNLSRFAGSSWLHGRILHEHGSLPVPQSRRLPERLGGSSTEMEGGTLPSPLGGSYLSHRVDLSELQA